MHIIACWILNGGREVDTRGEKYMLNEIKGVVENRDEKWISRKGNLSSAM